MTDLTSDPVEYLYYLELIRIDVKRAVPENIIAGSFNALNHRLIWVEPIYTYESGDLKILFDGWLIDLERYFVNIKKYRRDIIMSKLKEGLDV